MLQEHTRCDDVESQLGIAVPVDGVLEHQHSRDGVLLTACCPCRPLTGRLCSKCAKICQCSWSRQLMMGAGQVSSRSAGVLAWPSSFHLKTFSQGKAVTLGGGVGRGARGTRAHLWRRRAPSAARPCAAAPWSPPAAITTMQPPSLRIHHASSCAEMQSSTCFTA